MHSSFDKQDLGHSLEVSNFYEHPVVVLYFPVSHKKSTARVYALSINEILDRIKK